MRATIEAKAVFELELSVELVDLLGRKSAEHYDQKCNQASRRGGLLYKWDNQITFGTTCSATFAEIDLTLKICEFVCEDPNYSDNDKRLLSEYEKFAFKLLREQSEFLSKIKPLNIQQ